jgi:hypothetical protein
MFCILYTFPTIYQTHKSDKRFENGAKKTMQNWISLQNTDLSIFRYALKPKWIWENILNKKVAHFSQLFINILHASIRWTLWKGAQKILHKVWS